MKYRRCSFLLLLRENNYRQGSTHHHPCTQEVQVGGLGTMYSRIYIEISKPHLKAKETNEQQKDAI